LLIQVIYGPNLNLLRDPAIYGSEPLDVTTKRLTLLAQDLGAELTAFQSNDEGALVTKIQQALVTKCDGILINPAAYGHTSIAMRDALEAVAVPFVEVHLSNVYGREKFRHRSLLSELAAGIVIGFAADSYLLGLRGLVEKIKSQKK
jgi:3-dehydroquinate dehydratase-2